MYVDPEHTEGIHLYMYISLEFLMLEFNQYKAREKLKAEGYSLNGNEN